MTGDSSGRPPRGHRSASAADEIRRLLAGDCRDPHRILGPHRVEAAGATHVVVRAFHPDATRVECLLDEGESVVALSRLDAGGLFEGKLGRPECPDAYRLRFHFADGTVWERRDPYRFRPTIGELDLHLLGEGTHRRLWEMLGARLKRVDGVDGTAFAVWAPNAKHVSVVGDFCAWDGRLLTMRSLGASGVFELFVPGVGAGALYKFEIRTREGALRLKADPLARAAEQPPGTASRVCASTHRWGDGAWMQARIGRDITREPVAIYEAHLASWARVPEEGDRSLSYREIAPRLVEHLKRLCFTHVELMPVFEHPFEGSWGYQVSGYYAPSARWGDPDDFRYLVDQLHQNGIGVILDWVPAHFPRDDFALRRFDGTALYEHADPQRGEHPDWGTLIFDYGRPEVRNFLVANALYWLEEFHVDGLRVDAVASMLYLDYSREPGEWTPNAHGGRENLDACGFLRALNVAVAEEQPGCFTAAEESSGWPGVTQSPAEGGLGFTFKWNMGWMHDTLGYFSRDPIHRRWHQADLTFSMLYEGSERFLMPLSHDEVVHGKRSLLGRMPGDPWQRFANLRTLLAYQWLRPGKKLVFMGTELAPEAEWDHTRSLPWHRADEPLCAGLATCMGALGALYRDEPALFANDPETGGFEWIDCADEDNCVLAWQRSVGERCIVVVVNLLPTAHARYRIGVPGPGTWRVRLDTDDLRFGGSGYRTDPGFDAESAPWHGRPWSIEVVLPPLAALALSRDPR